MSKQTSLLAVGVAVLALLGTSVALADTMTNDSTHGGTMTDSMSHTMMTHPAQMVVTVSDNGTGRLRGTVASVSGTSITITGWGGTWTVTTDANTLVLGIDAVSSIKVGDFVGAQGTFSQDGQTVAATVVRDWSAEAMMHGSSASGDHMMSSSTQMTH